MRRIGWPALLLLALSTGAAQAQEAPAAHFGFSWLAGGWEALADLVEVIFAGDQELPAPPEATNVDGDCGAGIDPTGGCRG
jgi:hypothetical protein